MLVEVDTSRCVFYFSGINKANNIGEEVDADQRLRAGVFTGLQGDMGQDGGWWAVT